MKALRQIRRIFAMRFSAGALCVGAVLHALMLAAAPALILLPGVARAEVDNCVATFPAMIGVYSAGRPPTLTSYVRLVCERSPSAGPVRYAMCVLTQPPGGAAWVLRKDGGEDEIPFEPRFLDDDGAGAVPSPDTPGVVAGSSIIAAADDTIITVETPFRALDLPDAPGISEGEYQAILTGEALLVEGDSCRPGGDGQDYAAREAFTGSITVDYTATCSLISTNAINFGSVLTNGFRTQGQNAFGGVSVTCAAGADWTLYVGDGGLADGGLRHMAQGSGENVLSYRLCRDSNCTLPWPVGVPVGPVGGEGGLTLEGQGVPQTVTIYGQIPAGEPLPPPGLYEDRVIVTVVY